MKKLHIPRPERRMRFAEKFGKGVPHFGRRERYERPGFGHIPLLLGCMAGAILLTVGILCLGRLWRVREVTARDGEHYTAAVLIGRSDLSAGDEMMGFDTWAVEQRLREELPLLEWVQVKKHLSGKVTIRASEISEVYYTRHNQNYYMINAETNEVLCVTPGPEEARRVGAVYVGIPEATRVRVGEKLSFVNLPYAPESTLPDIGYELETDTPDREYAYVPGFIETLRASELYPRVTGMELGDRYDLWLVLDRQVKVCMGDSRELERKLSLVGLVLEDRVGVDDPSLPTLIDVSDPARIIHRQSPDIALPDWAEGLPG